VTYLSGIVAFKAVVQVSGHPHVVSVRSGRALKHVDVVEALIHRDSDLYTDSDADWLAKAKFAA